MNEQHRLVNILSMGSMLLLEIGWAVICLYTNIVKSILPVTWSFDIFYYIFSIFLAFFSFIIVNFFFRNKIGFSIPSNEKREALSEVAIIILFVIAAGIVFLYEKDIYFADMEYMPWHTSRTLEWMILLVTGLALIQIWVLLKNRKVYKVKKRNLRLLYVILAIVAGYAIYQPNSFNDYNSLYHANAYFNSVYRVLHLEPYNEINSGMYGFYGIILAPFVKVCGADFRAFMVVMSVITVIIMLCYFYVLDCITSDWDIKVLGSIGIIAVTTALWAKIYLQTYPSRLFFAGLILAWIVRKEKIEEKNNGISKICSLILLTLSLVWNLETGLGCVLGFTGSEIVGLLQKESLRQRLFWKKAVLKLLWFPISFFCAYSFVGVYNLVVSGKFILLKDFLFPFIGNPYVQDLNLDLQVFPSFWMLICIFIFVMIAVILLSTDLCGNRKKERSIQYVSACTLICIAQMVYYINRSVRANLFLTFPMLILMMSGFIEKLRTQDAWNKSTIGNGILRGMETCGVWILLLGAFLTCANSLTLEARREQNRDLESIENWTEIIQREVLPNTLGIGIGVPELYSYLGWDTGYYGIDIPDFAYAQEEAQQYVYEIIKQTDYIFVEDDSLQFITGYAGELLDPFYETHQILCSYKFGAGTYSFYGRIGEQEG